MADRRDDRVDRVLAADTGAGAAVATLLIAVPLYRAPELIPDLFAALAEIDAEIAGLGGRVLLINDSPDDRALAEMLSRTLPALAARVAVELRTNDANIGFVRSANLALALARDSGADLILLNSDARPTPGAFRELAEVVRTDAMIGFASPRSNHATICNSPYLDDYRSKDLAASYAAHRAIEHHLPRVTYIPTAVGFCIYIRNLMLREFGLFDEVYGRGYNEENDFVRRCNQCGYRAVLANHAYVHHIGSVSFNSSEIPTDATDDRNHDILIGRYPEYDRIVERYFSSAEYWAQKLTAGLIADADGRLRILFDCRVLLCHHNGTQENIRHLITAFAARYGARYAIHILCDADAFAFHGLDRVPRIMRCGEADLWRRAFAVAMRLGQPFNLKDLVFPARVAPLTGFLMLDAIAMDCQQLDEHDLDTLWQHMFDTVDLVGYNSHFTRDQFHRRFNVPERIAEFVALCSTDVREYVDRPPDDGSGEEPRNGHARGGMLLMGNHYPHKHVLPTLSAIREGGADRVVVLGVEVEQDETVVSYRAGLVPQPLVDHLYEDAELLVFPSHYEGFGLPLLHAIARATPVVARDLPVTREIRERLVDGHNIHLAATTRELVDLALARPAWRDGDRPTTAAAQGWAEAADALGQAMDRAIAAFDFETCQQHQLRIWALRRRLDADHAIGEAQARQGAAEHKAAREAARVKALLATCAPHFADLRELTGRAALLRGAGLLDEAAQPTGWRALVGRIRGGAATAPAAIVDAAGLPAADAALHARLLDAAAGVAVGTRIAIRDMARSTRPGSPAARELLANAGCVPLPSGDDHGPLIAIKVADWRAPLPGPDDPALFVEFVHHRLLGRAPSREEAAQLAATLRHGGSREALLRGLHLTEERRAGIAAHLDAAPAS